MLQPCTLEPGEVGGRLASLAACDVGHHGADTGEMPEAQVGSKDLRKRPGE